MKGRLLKTRKVPARSQSEKIAVNASLSEKPNFLSENRKLWSSRDDSRLCSAEVISAAERESPLIYAQNVAEFSTGPITPLR